MAITVTVTGVPEVTRDLKALTPTLERQVIARMAAVAADKMRDGAASHNVTGNLWGSVYDRKIPSGREVGHDPQKAPYAPFVVFGTRPHVIKPNKKKALRWAASGKFIFAKFVNHPGYVGDPYHIAAADEATRRFAAIVDEELKRIA